MADQRSAPQSQVLGVILDAATAFVWENQSRTIRADSREAFPVTGLSAVVVNRSRKYGEMDLLLGERSAAPGEVRSLRLELVGHSMAAKDSCAHRCRLALNDAP